jgi:hypothetical protein
MTRYTIQKEFLIQEMMNNKEPTKRQTRRVSCFSLCKLSKMATASKIDPPSKRYTYVMGKKKQMKESTLTNEGINIGKNLCRKRNVCMKSMTLHQI